MVEVADTDGDGDIVGDLNPSRGTTEAKMTHMFVHRKHYRWKWEVL